MKAGKKFQIATPGQSGGAEGDRTPDLMTASHALSQLSYGPKKESKSNVPLKRRSSECDFDWRFAIGDCGLEFYLS